ncbi:MAG: DUF2723 domain-containing protein [Bacteroidota bacterium]
MENKTLNRTVAAILFMTTSVVYFVTMAPTVVFWDVGEFIAAAWMLQVPHPPGSPLFLLITRAVLMIPFSEDIAVRAHSISAVTSALTVALLYLVTVKVIMHLRKPPESTWDKVTVYGASAIGALSLAFATTFWDNAIEAEVYGVSMFFLSLIVWLAMRWYERANQPGNEKYVLLIAYLIGLSIGIHLLALLTIFTVLIIIYIRNYEVNRATFLKLGLVAVAIFFVVYPGIVKWLPSLMIGELALGGRKIEDSNFLRAVPFLVIGAALYGVYYSIKNNLRLLNITVLSFLLIIIGYSTYTMVIIRSNADPPMNENEPKNLTRLVSYLNREQYGDAPVIERRYDPEPQKVAAMSRYSSDLDFMLRYQINHMYVRYLLWNYVGAAGDLQDSGVSWKDTWGIPFLLGLMGVYFHIRRDWKMAMPFVVTFIIMGVVLALFQNQQEPQPRERDYFYVGSFYVFSLWIALGVYGILESIRLLIQRKKIATLAGVAFFGISFAAVPLNMLMTNWRDHDSSKNYVAWDYSYNMLQSCAENAVLFTNGDNDTFPLWYLQDVEGIRRDVRIVNLSLLNTPWYIRQLKHQKPYGTATVPINLPDGRIDTITPIGFKPRDVEIPVPPEAYEAFGITDTSITNRGAIRWRMKPTYQVGDVGALKVQDLMVYDIVMTSGWKRPVYFAVTTAPSSKLGLDPYLRMEGLSMRLTPASTSHVDYGLTEEILQKNLLEEPETFSLGPQHGFRWRGLKDTTIYYNQNERRLMLNYRNSFIQLAFYYAEKNDRAKTLKTLNRMEEVISDENFPIDWRLIQPIATMYHRFGELERFEKYASKIEEISWRMIQRGQADIRRPFNAYQRLLEIYELQKRYQDALNVLNLVAEYYPDDSGVQTRIEQLKARISVDSAATVLPDTQTMRK